MNDTKKEFDRTDKTRNPEPITKAHGSHLVGTGIGAIAGGAAAGAAVGTVAGPVGTIAGAAVGAVVGGVAGKRVAEVVNPTIEDAYWRENHSRQPYAAGRLYDDYGPAYRIGYEGYAQFGATGCTFEDREVELRKRYEVTQPKLAWNEARAASRAAWQRIREQPPKGHKTA
jgi:hypothetical protein